MMKWKIDPDHSTARFSVQHFMIANVEGLFSSVKGAIRFGPRDLVHLGVEAEIDVTTLTTGHSERDEHLLSPDYFDAERYPCILFRSTGVEAVNGSRGKIRGDLTIREITRPIIFEFECFGPVKGPFNRGVTSIGFSAHGRLNREDYGLAWNAMLEGGGLVMGTEVRLNMEVEADLVSG
jgi:polyisoprenoid-binding protein YceI